MKERGTPTEYRNSVGVPQPDPRHIVSTLISGGALDGHRIP